MGLYSYAVNGLLSIFFVPLSFLLLLALWPGLQLIRLWNWIVKVPTSSVRNRVVVITGASSGIGEYMAYQYAKRGARLVLSARREQRLQEVSKKCQGMGASGVLIVQADVSKQADCNNIIDRAVEKFNRLDVLVNNAGIAHSGLFEDYEDPAHFKPTLDVDFWGNIYTTMRALPHLREAGGQVVVTASVAGYLTYPRQAMYNAAKAGIIQFYDTLRAEEPTIDVTIAMPGFIISELTTKTAAAAPGHIPKWWPMMRTETAAEIMVSAAVQKKHYVIVPYWYSAWILFRLFEPEWMDWCQRPLLLGRAPARPLEIIFQSLCGEDTAQHSFEKLATVSG